MGLRTIFGSPNHSRGSGLNTVHLAEKLLNFAHGKESEKIARSKVGLGSGVRFADYLSTGLLARAFPSKVINVALNLHQCSSERVRTFPATAVVCITPWP